MKTNGEKIEPQPTRAPEDEITLTKFVKDNYSLLATIGIFVALTVFSQSIQLKAIGYFLSFLFLSCAVLVMVEIYTNISEAKYSGRLRWFTKTLSFAILIAILYWLLEFRVMWRALIFLPLTTIPLTLFGWIINRPRVSRVLTKIVPEQPGPRMLVTYLAAFGLVALSGYISLKLAGPVNEWLDGLRRVLEKLPGQ